MSVITREGRGREIEEKRRDDVRGGMDMIRRKRGGETSELPKSIAREWTSHREMCCSRGSFP